MNEEVLNLILSHIPKDHKSFYHFETDDVFGCQSSVFAQIFSIIFNREKPSANYFVAAHTLNYQYILLHDNLAYSFAHYEVTEITEEELKNYVPTSKEEFLYLLEENGDSCVLPYEVVDFYNLNKEDVDNDHNPLWEQSFSTREEVLEKVKYVQYNFSDIDDPDDSILKIAELIMDVLELEPVFINHPQLTPHSFLFLEEKVNSIYEQIKDSETHEFRTKERIYECLKQTLENQPPNPFHKFNQRLVKILAEFIHWVEEEEMVDEFVLPAMEQLEKAGLTGILEVWKKWQEMLGSDLDYHQVFTNLETGITNFTTDHLVPDRLIMEYPKLADMEKEMLELPSNFTMY